MSSRRSPTRVSLSAVRKSKTPRPTWLALGACLLAAGTAAGQSLTQNPAEVYRIAQGDVLSIYVWKEPELSREIRVRPDGKISVPLIGDLVAAGENPESLAKLLTERLEKFLAAPRVVVGLAQSSQLRFFVVGQVGKPGEYPLVSRMTVIQALAIAGGLTEFAKSEEITIVRRITTVGPDGKALEREMVLPFNYKRLAESRDLKLNTVLAAGDTIVVP